MTLAKHNFLDSGDGLCDYYFTDYIGEGYVRHVQCALSKDDRTHNMKGGLNA